ncbi:MAG: SDR family oxidoreductase [Alphaproteobacteria bacterium]
MDLAGRAAVVTGGAAGIGFAVAERLAASGAVVEFWDRDAEALAAAAERLGVDTRTTAVDVTDAAAVQEAAEGAVAGIGRIDILCANAGIAGPNHATWEYPVKAWREIVEVDLNAVFYTLKAVVPGMIERNYGRIVTTASIAGKEGNPNAAAYSAAKAGVIALTKALGKELAHHDIAVNAITPAAARTRIFEQMSEDHIAFMLSKIPRGRFVDVAEIAAMVAWLCSAENSFTTGAVFDLSGGRASY